MATQIAIIVNDNARLITRRDGEPLQHLVFAGGIRLPQLVAADKTGTASQQLDYPPIMSPSRSQNSLKLRDDLVHSFYRGLLKDDIHTVCWRLGAEFTKEQWVLLQFLPL